MGRNEPTGKAWIVTGPTSGIGRRTALRLAGHGTVVLVGRSRQKLDAVAADIAKQGGRSQSVVCDFADLDSIGPAVDAIVALQLPIAGVLNNAGAFPIAAEQTPQGWDLAFTTNHLGPFAFTEALIPHLPDGANVVFTCSAVEDPERKPAVVAGFRGARFISAEACARGEWEPGGSKKPGYDAYATSKQCNLATVFALARETPRLRFNGVEPGFNPATGLAREANLPARLAARWLLAPLAPVVKYWSTPGRAAQMITSVLTDPSTGTGTYFDETGKPMLGSAQVRDPEFDARVVAETRALLAAPR